MRQKPVISAIRIYPRQIGFQRLLLITLLFSIFSSGGWAQGNTTPTYAGIIEAYKEIADSNPLTSRLDIVGTTDVGKPLHALIIDARGMFEPVTAGRNQVVCMILNGIHPGEPCGINASIAFAREKASHPDSNVVYCIIPVYNVGGALNRGSSSRANQNGPAEYGFRGNARNLDLNRDFIKNDSKNAQSFVSLYQKWAPEVFIDTHTSNGADYQPAMTLIAPFPEKLYPLQAKFLTMEFEPYLYRSMKARNEEMVPYVDPPHGTPDAGIAAFTDLPRYSMGYVGLFNTIGFTTEAHMWKPFERRVEATLTFLKAMDGFLSSRSSILIEMKRKADKATASTTEFGYDWKLLPLADSVSFPGYTADTLISEITGQPRLTYHRDQPYRKTIPYYRYHKARKQVRTPDYYLIPQAWPEVIHRLEANGIECSRITRDTLLAVEVTYVDSFKTVSQPYEGHYLHYETITRSRREKIQFYAGDYLISTNQKGRRFLAQVLTASAEDSFFNWGFFDSVLMQKEYYSAYIFEDTAGEILDRNPELRRQFEDLKEQDAQFARNSRAQLDFIYRHSKYYEPTHNRLPVYEIR